MLENYTYEELKKVIEEAPAGWEGVTLEDNHSHLSYYSRNVSKIICRERMIHTWVEFTPNYNYPFTYYTKQQITEEIAKKGYQVTLDALIPVPKEDLIAQVLEANIEREAVTIDIGEFVNYVKVEDGKVLVNVDKCDVEGIVGLFGGNGG